jgi:hypothetical protein
VGSVKAGKFGSPGYRCDAPALTFQETLRFIESSIKPDVVLWTGDNSPHDSPWTTEEEVISATVYST